MDETLRQLVGQMFHERWGRLGPGGLLREERDHVLLWCLHAEVQNGGMEQYLTNSSGDNALETIDALERASMPLVADVLRRALAAMPNGWDADRDIRIGRVLDTPNRNEVWNLLSFEYDDAIAAEPPTDALAEAILAAYRREGLIEIA